MAYVLVLFGRETLGHTVSAAPLPLKHTHTDRFTFNHGNVKMQHIGLSVCMFFCIPLHITQTLCKKITRGNMIEPKHI